MGRRRFSRRGRDLAVMVAAAAPTATMTALDLGTAAGHKAFAFAPHVREVIGTDVSTGMLAEATRQAAVRGLTNVRFEEADLTALPFADAAFDLVTCRQVAHICPRSPAARCGACPDNRGGSSSVVDPISPEDPVLAGWLNTVERLRDPSHGRDWSLSEWTAAGKRSGCHLRWSRSSRCRSISRTGQPASKRRPVPWRNWNGSLTAQRRMCEQPSRSWNRRNGVFSCRAPSYEA